MILIQTIKILVIEKRKHEKKINNVSNDVLICDFY